MVVKARFGIAALVPIIVGLGMTGCASTGSDRAADEANSTPDSFTADITLTSSTPVTLGYVEGDVCGGMGNDAMKEGKQYRFEAKGETIALGKLPAGEAVESAGSLECHFNFSVDLPPGLGFYTLDMGEFQGTAEFSEDELASGVQADRIDFEGRN